MREDRIESAKRPRLMPSLVTVSYFYFINFNITKYLFQKYQQGTILSVFAHDSIFSSFWLCKVIKASTKKQVQVQWFTEKALNQFHLMEDTARDTIKLGTTATVLP